MAERTTKNGALYTNHENRIGALETLVGQEPTQENYVDAAALRAITDYDTAHVYYVDTLLTFFVFNATSTDVDDGISRIKPNNIDVGDPGRYHLTTEVALKNHAHSNYQTKLDTPTTLRFLFVDANGQIYESTYHANTWAAYDHAHDELYADIDDFEALKQDVADLETAIAEKLDILAATAGDVGKFTTVAADGTLTISDTKLDQVKRKTTTQTIPNDDVGIDITTTTEDEPCSFEVKDNAGHLLAWPTQVDITVTENETTGWNINVVSRIGVIEDAKISYV
jgi:hypothetical protein